MPGFVKTPADEKKWERAKALAMKDSDENYALANYIFHKMKKSKKKDRKSALE